MKNSKDKDVIFYIISSYSGGKGGHYYSLITIANELKEKFEIIVINIGLNKAEALNYWNGSLYFIRSNGINFGIVYNKLLNIYKKFQPILLHSFDVHSALFTRKVSSKAKVPYIVTKCGGPRPDKSGRIWKYYYPTFDVQTVFNDDDFEYFKKNKSNNYLVNIKQRVSDPKTSLVKDGIMNNEIGEILNSNDKYLNILRVGRIGYKYKNTITQSINLVKSFNSNGIPSNLIVIGYIESERCLNDLKAISTKNVHFFTDNEYTMKASRFLRSADISIGTGRNFMESCAFGCIVFAPVSRSKYPSLVTKSNFTHFEKSNFSDRTEINKQVDPDKQIESVHEVISSVEQRKKISNEMRDLFDSEFDIKKGAVKYIQTYQFTIEQKVTKTNRYDIILHSIVSRFKILIKHIGKWK